ncbi:MAG: redoxin domain-containing protein [candidate division Zixibacteria bacterium]|nr:redoxin domain-containing protein [candidate division Zixibacteria bacterium]
MPAYERDTKCFESLNTQVLGISVDSIPSLQAWQKSLGGIMYPLLSDFFPQGEIAKKYGILTDSGFSDRAVFIINKEGIISFIDKIGYRNVPNIGLVFSELSKLS